MALTIQVLTTAGGNYKLNVEENATVQDALAKESISLEGATVRFQAQAGGGASPVQPNAPVQEGTYVVTKNVANG
jgi:hypothetical protein